MWVSYLAYPNLLGTKGLVVVVVVVVPYDYLSKFKKNIRDIYCAVN